MRRISSCSAARSRAGRAFKTGGEDAAKNGNNTSRGAPIYDSTEGNHSVSLSGVAQRLPRRSCGYPPDCPQQQFRQGGAHKPGNLQRRRGRAGQGERGQRLSGLVRADHTLYAAGSLQDSQALTLTNKAPLHGQPIQGTKSPSICCWQRRSVSMKQLAMATNLQAVPAPGSSPSATRRQE